MKKKLFLSMATLLVLLLAGCSSIEEHLRDQMLKKSTVLDETDYLAYEQYACEGNLDNEGYYIEETDPVDDETAPIHVTFADNNNLKITYFSDASHHNALNGSECYLNLGDSIYAHVEISDDVFSSMYEFSCFKIYEIDEDGKRKELPAIITEGQSPDLSITIPPAFDGAELSVVPIGAYQERTISLSAIAYDNDDNKKMISGTWLINDKEYQGNSATINAASSYIISYQYDSNSYFYVSSEPECYYNDNFDGIVIFKQRDPSDSTLSYSVELHEYINLKHVSDMDRLVGIDGKEMTLYEANQEVTFSRLRYGQRVVLTTNKEWADLENWNDMILESSGIESGNYKYTLLVPEKDGQFWFDPSEYSYENGTIRFRCHGNIVTRPISLAKGTKIIYEQDTAKEGYWLAPGDNIVIVGEESDTRQQLMDIHFTQKVNVTVSLEQPDYGGKVYYSVDGNRIYTKTYSTFSGTEIKMEFKPWPGWVLNDNAHDEDVYVVNDNKSQTVKGPGYNIDSVFSEAPNHKPNLTVTLNKSVGNMTFSVSASGCNADSRVYDPGFVEGIFSGSMDIVDKQPIGTECPIRIIIGNRALEPNKAVKFVTVKTDTTGNELSETRYVTDLSAWLDPFHIYAPYELGQSEQYFEAIHISISVVDISSFSMPTTPNHSAITVRNMLTNKLMSGGELIEESEKVTVSISPEYGYYITGKNVTGDYYQQTMKYSDYLEDISGIIKEHPAEKYLSVTLDSSDAFATYTYKLNGDEVSGRINVKNGQEISLTYKITDSEHKLAEGAGGVFGIGASYTDVTKKISISPEMDGKIITKDDFGIKVVEVDE